MPFRTIKKLGQGVSGQVYLVENSDTGKKLVVKILNFDVNIRKKVNIAREIAVLKQIKPVCKKYLMCLNNVKKTDGKIIISIDYIENSHELYEFLSNHFLEMTIFPKFVIMQKLLLGLAQLHSVGVVHKDIKPQNILIVEDTLQPHYIDYGFSCIKSNVKCLNKRVGSPLYLAPEMLQRMALSFNANKAADIWSLGIVFIGLCFGSSLWEAETKYELYKMIENSTDDIITQHVNRSAQIFADENKNANPEEITFMKKLIRPMLIRDYAKRPSATDMLKIFAKANNKLLILAKNRSLNVPKSGHKAVLKLIKGGGSVELHKNIARAGRHSMKAITTSQPLYGV